jgi:hypothetical protein
MEKYSPLTNIIIHFEPIIIAINLVEFLNINSMSDPAIWLIVW